MQRLLLEEHIRLINEHDCFPGSGNVKDFLERVIKTPGSGTQVTATNDV